MHLMVDLETLALDEGALILQVGAVEFFPYEGAIGKTFSWDLSLKDQGFRHIDADTVLWWMNQSDEARKAVSVPEESRVSLEMFFVFFSTLVRAADKVWAHYTDFDLRKLNSLYASHAFDLADPAPVLIPWHKWRDSVALRDFVAQANGGQLPLFPGEGKDHIAANDALVQAKMVIEAYRLMKAGAHGNS